MHWIDGCKCVQLARLSVFAMVLVGIAAHAQSSPTQPQDIQELKDKLQQLEEEVQTLKQKIGAVESGKPQAPPAQPSATATPTPTGMEPSEQTGPPEKKKSIDFYGYVMLDTGYEFGQSDPAWFDVMRPTKLPSFPEQFAPDGKVYFGVRQTRFGIKTTNPTPFGDLKTQFEFELFGVGANAGQTTFRLRHAYGEIGKVGAGQTWSPFMDPDVFPNSLEYWGPNGMVFFRNVQVRYMPVKNDHMQITFAAEQPGASGDQGVYAGRVELANIKPNFEMPDFSWQARMMRDWGHLQIAGIFRKIAWVDATPNPTFRLGDETLGWGVNVSSNLKLSKSNLAKLQVVYGNGIQNYMNDAPIDIGVKTTANPLRPVVGVPLPVLGVVGFLDHDWSKRFSSTAGYSMVNIDNSNAQAPSDYHQGHYALTNLLFHPVQPVTIGGEFQFGRRVNFADGFNVNDYRIQFGFKYDWKKVIEY